MVLRKTKPNNEHTLPHPLHANDSTEQWASGATLTKPNRLHLPHPLHFTYFYRNRHIYICIYICILFTYFYMYHRPNNEHRFPHRQNRTDFICHTRCMLSNGAKRWYHRWQHRTMSNEPPYMNITDRTMSIICHIDKTEPTSFATSAACYRTGLSDGITDDNTEQWAMNRHIWISQTEQWASFATSTKPNRLHLQHPLHAIERG